MKYDTIAEAYVGMLRENIESHLDKIRQSGRYDVKSVTPLTYTTGHNVIYETIKPSHAQYFNHYINIARNRGKTSWYDPQYATLEKSDIGESFESQRPVLKPEHSAVIDTVASPDKMYRGISSEEYDSIMKTGKIKSRGQYNMDGQEGLTYFTNDPTAAKSYAHSFAPLHYKATHEKPAYVIAVKNPGTGISIPGTGEHEIGIPHEISKHDIIEVHRGIPYASYSGSQDYIKEWSDSDYRESSGSHPISYLVWERIK